MTYWLLSANPKTYNHEKAFKRGYIDWSQKNNFEVGDIVYICTSGQGGRIKYKTEVKKINLTSNEIGDDKDFWKKDDNYKNNKKFNKFVHLELISASENNELILKNIRNKKYIKNTPQRSMKINNTDFIEFLNNIFENNTIINNFPTKNFPLNQILYGPPGTGKTYNVLKLINEILGKNPGLNTEDEKQKINSIINNLNWWSVIALTMYKKNKDANHKVADLQEENILNIFIQNKESKSIISTIWGELQAHTSPISNTVKTTNRREPFVFDKTEDSEWYLTDDGKKFVEENLSEQLELLNIKNCTRKIEDFYKFLTFHQSYSYEEFVEGIKPKIDENNISYEYNKGVFKEICQQANSDPDNKYLLIIDEINRGNISKIFGELITLIEEDKRVTPNGERIFENTITEKEQLLVTLPYTKSKFGVPKNLYILGTMNTSDRSIASIDIALRRRFKFVEIMPDSNLVANFGYNFKECFEILNTKIKILLDRDHQIGHSYFIKTKYENAGIEELKQIWFDSVIPLLNEYFYSDWEKLQAILGNANENGFIKKINTNILNGFDLCENDSFDFNYNCDFKEAMKNAFRDIFKQENNENT